MLTKLTPELRRNILSRLPVDSLLRFRCVSKSYCAEIDDPKFIEIHLKRSLKTNSNQGMIFADVNPQFLRCVTFDSPDRVAKLDYPLKSDAIFNSDNIKVVGNCNGLLCFSNAVGRIVLINPSTRKFQTLPLPPVEHKTKNKIDCNTWTLGFGYDPIGEDYKVVRLGQYIGVSSGYFVSETMIYNLKSNSWRKIQGMNYILGGDHKMGTDHKMGMLLGYDLHWIVGRDMVSPSTNSFVIVAFNLGSESFMEVPGPDLIIWIGSARLIGMCVGIVGKWLSVNTIHYDTVCGMTSEIWVMKVYGVKESWTKLVSVSPSPPFMCVRSPLSKNGDEFVIGMDVKQLVWYNPEKKICKFMELPNAPGSIYAAEFFNGSLVPLNVNTKKVGSKKAGSKGKKKKR